MNKLLKLVIDAADNFITEKDITIRNNSIYLSIFSSINSGFARKVSPSDSPRMIALFFEELRAYDEECNSEHFGELI